MTEYWVSQAKHWCTYCKQWISANKHEIKRHEEGRKHKEAVQEFFKKKREERRESTKNETAVQKELRLLEEEAQNRYQSDMSSGRVANLGARAGALGLGARGRMSAHANSGTSLRSRSGMAPPPPPTAAVQGSEPLLDIVASPDDPLPGMYIAHNRVWLEGDKNEQKIAAGRECQAVYAGDDEWYDAVVVSVRETQVPHMQLVLRRFVVRFVGYSGDDAEATVNSRDVRLPVKPPPPPPEEEEAEGGEGEGGAAASADGGDGDGEVDARGEAPADKAAARGVDDSTGLGAWESVAAPAPAPADDDADAATVGEATGAASQAKQLLDDDDDERNTGIHSGKYRGIAIDDLGDGDEQLGQPRKVPTPALTRFSSEPRRPGDAELPSATFGGKKKRAGSAAGGRRFKRRKKRADDDE